MADPKGASTGRMRLITWAAILTAALCIVPTSRAQQGDQELATEPVLRIETGLHVAPVRAISADAESHFAVTASDDKTARVWSLPDGKLQSVLRLPLGAGDNGKAKAVAISSDGRTIAVGGYTGSTGHYNIFLFDRATSALTQRLTDLPDVIFDLVYSPDGKRLAASLGGNGIRVFDVGQGYRLLPSDTNYMQASRSAMFDRRGRLVTASDDGVVRLYAAGQYTQPLKQLHLSDYRISTVAFSPDAKYVAIAFEEVSKVVVLSGADLTKLFEVDTSGVANVGLRAVGWSRDGRFLFAGGFRNADGVWQIRRWTDGGKGTFTDIALDSDAVFQILGLESGSILYGCQSGFGVISPEAVSKSLQSFGALDLRGGGGHELLVSEDGNTTQIDSLKPQHSYRFALSDRSVEVDPSAAASLAVPVTQAPGLDITGWSNSTQAAVNGRPIKLRAYELARSLAVARGTEHFVLGSDWSVRLLDGLGRERWNRPGPGVAWHVNVTGDGRLVLVAYGDGTVRWLRLSDGAELLALFIHPDGKRWVAWTPQGYYEASVGGEELIGWQVNHGLDQIPDFFPVSRFRDRFYRPDIVELVLKTVDVDEAVRQANAESGRRAAGPMVAGEVLPPVMEIVDPADRSAVASSPIEISYRVRSTTPVTGITVLVDGRPVQTAPPKEIMSAGTETIASVSVAIPHRDVTISLIAHSSNYASEPASARLTWRGETPALQKPELFALLIGVSQYGDSTLNLKYPAKDANDVAEVLKRQSGGLYRGVHVTTLTDENATREAILDALETIQQHSSPSDVVFIFLFGHGVTESGTYFFLTTDSDPKRLRRTAVSGDDLREAFSRMSGKVLFFADTCHAGAVTQMRGTTTPDIDRLANELISAENGTIVFTSCAGGQSPLELSDSKNGAFAKALVEGLSGEADVSKSGVITIADLEIWLSLRVKDLTAGGQTPASAMPKTVSDFPIAFVVPRSPIEAQGTAPRLEITLPDATRGTISISTNETELSGRVLPMDNVFMVLVDSRRISVDDEGRFHETLHLIQGVNRVMITAIGRDQTVQSTILSIQHGDEHVTSLATGNYYAMVIGEQDYQAQEFPTLTTPRNDAVAVSTLLHESFGFHTTIDLPGQTNVSLLLVDKSRDEILDLLEDLRDNLDAADSLLIYYAGHGKRTEQRGFWIPSSAKKDKLSTFIMDADISEDIAAMKAKHVLIVSDSCYSSAMYRSDSSIEQLSQADEDRSRLLENAMSRVSRRLLTSGSDEPVVDVGGNGHSVFADEFLDALRTMQPSAFTEEELYLRIKPKVLSRSNQTPTTRAIPNVGDKEGHFVFRRVDGLTNSQRLGEGTP